MNVLQGFGLFFLLGGLVGGIERIFRKRAQVRRAVQVNARIIDVESDEIADGDNVTWYFPVVTFTVDGKSIRVKLPRGSVRRDDYRVGGTIRVYYDLSARRRQWPGYGTSQVAGRRRSLRRCSWRSGPGCAGWGGAADVGPRRLAAECPMRIPRH